MHKFAKVYSKSGNICVEVKSKLDAEFRRISVTKEKSITFEEFYAMLERLHNMKSTPFTIFYTDPKDGDLLPINNDDNFARALYTATPLLRIFLQRKGQNYHESFGIHRKKNTIGRFIGLESKSPLHTTIGLPEDFRRVSAIIDVDIIPETHRRVKLMKNGSDKPLGFYIRDGVGLRVTPHGIEKVPAIFISRLLPGGLAESTGLLAVNDEVVEVNGIEVSGKTLDQVTDMMVANSSNLIITIKPANQLNSIASRHGSKNAKNNDLAQLFETAPIIDGGDEINEYVELPEDDEIKEHTDIQNINDKSNSATSSDP